MELQSLSPETQQLSPVFSVKIDESPLDLIARHSDEWSARYGGPLAFLCQLSKEQNQWLDCPSDPQMIDRFLFRSGDMVINTGFHLLGNSEYIDRWESALEELRSNYKAVFCFVPSEPYALFQQITR